MSSSDICTLYKMRALAVRDRLKALGVFDEKIELRKPEKMTASSSHAEARRMDVAVQ